MSRTEIRMAISRRRNSNKPLPAARYSSSCMNERRSASALSQIWSAAPAWPGATMTSVTVA